MKFKKLKRDAHVNIYTYKGYLYVELEAHLTLKMSYFQRCKDVSSCKNYFEVLIYLKPKDYKVIIFNALYYKT